MFNRKVMKEMSLSAIHADFSKFGFELTDAEFSSLTYSEVRKLYRKAEKSYQLKQAVANDLLHKFKPKAEKVVKKNG